jgi:hypothetical protein
VYSVSRTGWADQKRPAIAGSLLASSAVVARVTPSAIPVPLPLSDAVRLTVDRTGARPAAHRSPTPRGRPDPSGRNRPHGRSVFFNKINFRFFADSAATIFLGPVPLNSRPPAIVRGFRTARTGSAARQRWPSAEAVHFWCDRFEFLTTVGAWRRSEVNRRHARHRRPGVRVMAAHNRKIVLSCLDWR